MFDFKFLDDVSLGIIEMHYFSVIFTFSKVCSRNCFSSTFASNLVTN